MLVNNKIALGSGARYANIFSLMTTQAVYEGQRAASSTSAFLFFPVRRLRERSATALQLGRATWSPTGLVLRGRFPRA